MIRSRSLLLALSLSFLLGFPSLPQAVTAELAGRKGRIQGESYANLRSGPDLRHRPLAVLKKGDIVTVEEESKNWYRVSLEDGQNGYVHKTLVGIIQEPDRAGPFSETKETSESSVPEPAPRIPAPKVEQPGASRASHWDGGSAPWWIAIGCVFLLGWIFGGNYYLKRDRTRTGRLRL